MSDKDMKLRLIVEAKNEAGAELERLHQQARRSGSAVAEAYQQAFALIGASTADVYGQMRLQYGADAAEFAQLTGDKETAYALYAKRLVELDRSAAASHRTLAAAAAEAFGSGIRAQADDFARSLVGVSSAVKTTEGVLGPLDQELEELRQATGLSSEEFANLQARFAQTTAEKAQENSLLSIAKAAVLSRAEIQQLGQTMGLNSAQIDRVTTAAHGAAPALNTLVSLSQSAQNGLSKTAEASVAGLAQDLTALSQGGRIAQTSLDGLGTELDELRRHSQLTDAQFAALQAKFQQTSAEKMQEQALRNLAASCNLTEQEIRELGTQFGLSRAQIESVVGSAKKAETSFLSLGTVARGALAYLSLQTLISFGRGVLDVTVQIDSLHRSLVAIYGSQSAAAAQMEFLRQTADHTGQNVYQLVDSYKTLSASTQGTILEGEATRKIFAAISEAGAVLGMSNERIKLSFMAVAQMASKGTVNMEDLRQQLGESLPGALRLFAEGMGKSTEEFIAMVEKGEVLSADLIKLANAIHATYGEAAETAGLESAQGAINKMSEAWTDLKANLIESDTAVAGINKVTAALKVLAEYAGLRSVWSTFAEGAELANKGLLDWEAFSQSTFLERQKMVDDLTRTENIAANHFTATWQAAERKSLDEYAAYASGRSKISEKQHQETLQYIETERQRIDAAYQTALKGAKTDPERLAVEKKYQEELTKLAEKSAKAQSSGARSELKQINAEISNYTAEARAAADAAEEWNRSAESAVDELLRLNDQIAVADMGEFGRIAFESARLISEGGKELEDYRQKLEQVDAAMATTATQYEVAAGRLAEAKTKLAANPAGTTVEDANKVRALEAEVDALTTALQGQTEQYIRLADARNQMVTTQAELRAKAEEHARYAALVSAYHEIGAVSAETFQLMVEHEQAEYNKFLELTGNKELAYRLFSQRLIALDRERREQQARDAFDVPALIQVGLEDYGEDVRDEALDFYRNLLPDAIDESSNALAEFVRDVAQGNATLAESWEALGESIENVVFDILEDLTAMYLKMSIMGLLGGAGWGGINLTTAGSTTSGQFSLDSIFGSVSGHHSGGVPGVDAPTFTRTVPLSTFMAAPRFHTGLKGNEFPAILEDGESVLTEGQMATIGKGLSAKSQAPQFNMTIVEAPGVKAETATTANDDGSFNVLVRMVESKVSQRMAKGQGLHKTMGNLYGARRKF